MLILIGPTPIIKRYLFFFVKLLLYQVLPHTVDNIVKISILKIRIMDNEILYIY